MYKITPKLSACHTGVVGKYYLEGHIPAEDIRRLLQEKPDIRGLSVPGMPAGVAGMEGKQKDSYKVFSIDKEGKVKVFSQH